MKKTKKEYLIYFLFFLIIMFLSPISGDDWGNYLEGSLGLKNIVENAIRLYFTWEGRFISRLLINILTYNKWLWNILNSLIITGIIYLINNICSFKNKKTSFLITTLFILLMNPFTFSQVVVWIAGNITYLFVVLLLLIYIKLIINNNFSKKKTTIMIIFNIIIPMFIEHMGIILIIINILFIIKDYIINKKINKKLIVFLLLSIISFLTMFLSPGNALRSKNENLEFNKLNIFEKIIYNLPNFIYYTYISNYLLILLMLIGNHMLFKKNIKSKQLKYILYIFNFFSIIFMIKAILIDRLQFSNNIITSFYYIVYSIISFILLIKNSKDIKNDIAIFFFIIGICSNGVMLLSPTWGYRTGFSCYLFMAISYLIIIDSNLKNNKIINISLLGINIFTMLIYLTLYISIHLQYIDNYKIIQESINNKITNIEIVSYPSYAPCNINPTNDYHLEKFKKYYGISDNTNITITENNWIFNLIYRKNNT